MQRTLFLRQLCKKWLYFLSLTAKICKKNCVQTLQYNEKYAKIENEI